MLTTLIAAKRHRKKDETVYLWTTDAVLYEDDRLLECCAVCVGDIVLMMEAVSTSETSVTFYQTIQRNIPEDSHLHTRLRENLKSHLM
jgi:hypothetical protein